MKKMIFASTAAVAALTLSACQSEEADAVEDAGEERAEQLDERADETDNEVMEDQLEQQADMVEEQAEEQANAMDDDGEIAPSETGMGDTQGNGM